MFVQDTVFFSGKKNKIKQNAASLEVVGATSERFNEPSRFIFAYLFILALSSSVMSKSLSANRSLVVYD